ncbi:MAG: hypothetical protein J6S58_02630, partial [Lentisphaeria bacterium]|nr:hypothetical protein [Lentisphaeria bacterium]
EMKSAFDRLPLFIISKLNDLIDHISDPDGMIDNIPSGISEGHTLKDLTRDIASGSFASYLTVLGSPLAEKILDITESISQIELIVSAMGNGSASCESALNEIKSRLSDLEGNLSELLSDLSTLSSEVEELNSKVNVEISEAIEELDFDLDDYRENLEEKIDVINGRLNGDIDLVIDCGGPGNL